MSVETQEVPAAREVADGGGGVPGVLEESPGVTLRLRRLQLQSRVVVSELQLEEDGVLPPFQEVHVSPVLPEVARSEPEVQEQVRI